MPVLLFTVMVSLFLAQPPRLVQAASSTSPSQTTVLVELFTSEGCSTCPPAEDLLADLLKRQPIPGVHLIGLAEHVDYWDHLGWKDRFSEHAFTQRQGVYARKLKVAEPYTPQLVVDGEKQVAGNDKSAVMRAIRDAARAPAATLALARLPSKNGEVDLSAAFSGIANGASGDLLAAVVEDDATTLVSDGENRGQTLQDVAAVRAMRYFGPITAGTTKALQIQLPPGSAPGKTHVVVFVQLPDQGRILAASSLPI